MRLDMRIRHGISPVHVGVRPASRLVLLSRTTTSSQLRTDDVRYFEDPEGVFGNFCGRGCRFYHDMGLMQGVLMPMVNQDTAVLLSPVSFLTRPARWMHCWPNIVERFLLAPNFGFELAMRRTSDDDMAGLDLGTCG